MSIFSKFFGKPSSHPIDAEHNWIAEETLPQISHFILNSQISSNEIFEIYKYVYFIGCIYCTIH